MMLLHVCCGPCAVYPGIILKEKNIDFDAYFYNPNIQPLEEFEKRCDSALIWAKNENAKMIISNEYTEVSWLEIEKQKSNRCQMCYDLRIKETCSFAKQNGYTSVTSTLLVSPYQDHDLIIDLFIKYSDKNNIDFFYYDFRIGFRKGQDIAKETGLYRQKYCGCLPSIQESSYMRKKAQ